MVNAVVLGGLFLLHVLWASESTAEINEARMRVMEEKFDQIYRMIQDIQEEVAALKRHSSVYDDETKNVALNNYVHGLESRVSALEGLNTTIVDLTKDVEDLQVGDSDLASRIDELDSRVGRVEQDGTVAFHAFLGSYKSIPQGSVIVFPNINVKIGNDYSGATWEFTVPSGGAGLYYLYAHFLFEAGNIVWIRIQVNGADLCVAFEDGLNAISYGGASCGAVVLLQEGSFTKTCMMCTVPLAKCTCTTVSYLCTTQ